MSAKLKKALKQIKETEHPEDLFGDVKTQEELKTSYRDWCKITHEDKCSDDEKHLAHEAFILLQNLYNLAEEKIKLKTYGQKVKKINITISGRKQIYQLDTLFRPGDISDIYKDKNFIIKISRSPATNILLKNEEENLNKIIKHSEGLEILRHIPHFYESFDILNNGQNLRVNVFEFKEKFYSLQEIIDAYPKGIDSRDMAWMFNRMMGSLLAAHQTGIIHGAITPKHILLDIETHNGILIDWCYSVKKGSLIKNIVPEYRSLYPKEVFDKRPADEGYDLYMLANCMMKVVDQNLLPRAIKGLLNACLLGYTYRYKDVWVLYQDFSNTLLALYGPKKFRTFVMPDTVKK